MNVVVTGAGGFIGSHLCRYLKNKGYWVTPVRPPTVPEGTARLRISVTYDHSREMLERFVNDIKHTKLSCKSVKV